MSIGSTLKVLGLQGKMATPVAASGNWAQTNAQQAFEKQIVETGSNKQVVASGNPVVKTPNNIKDGYVALDNGEAVPAILQVNINTNTLTAPTNIVIGRLNPYKAFNPLFAGNPIGVVTGKNNNANNYEIFMDELCAKTYIINSIKMTVSPSANAVSPTAYKAQLDIDWARYWTNGQGNLGSSTLDWSLTDNPNHFKEYIRTLDLSQKEGKFDMYSSVVIPVMEKVVISLQFFVSIRTIMA